MFKLIWIREKKESGQSACFWLGDWENSEVLRQERCRWRWMQAGEIKVLTGVESEVLQRADVDIWIYQHDWKFKSQEHLNWWKTMWAWRADWQSSVSGSWSVTMWPLLRNRFSSLVNLQPHLKCLKRATRKMLWWTWIASETYVCVLS